MYFTRMQFILRTSAIVFLYGVGDAFSSGNDVNFDFSELEDQHHEDYTDLIKERCSFTKIKLRYDDMDGARLRLIVPGFVFTDSSGKKWSAPVNTITDGASIPPIAQGIVSYPYGDKVKHPSIIHDAYCAEDNRQLVATWRTRSVSSTSRMFYEGCVLKGIGHVVGKSMYLAVYLFGPQWQCGQPDEHDSFWDVIPIAQIPLERKGFALLAYKSWVEAQKPHFTKVEILARFALMGLALEVILSPPPANYDIESFTNILVDQLETAKDNFSRHINEYKASILKLLPKFR